MQSLKLDIEHSTDLMQCIIPAPHYVISLTGTGSDSTWIVSGQDSMMRCTYDGVPTPISLWYI